MSRFLLGAFGALVLGGLASAHDTWVESSSSLVRPGEWVEVDLKLGNHGNEHRDFKLASKVTLDGCKVELITPSGSRKDLKASLLDQGFTPREGYWSARVQPEEAGLHCAVQSLDRVMKHGKTVRGIRTAKTYFLASPSLDHPVVPADSKSREALGLPFELVLETCPIRETGVGQPIRVRLLRDGKPVANAAVSFIPRGGVLKAGFDPDFQRKTDAEGRASFTPNEGNHYLIVAHLAAPEEKGEGYESTHYGATLTLRVPQKASVAR